MYPILFEFGFITLFSLWFFITIGFVVAALVFVRLAKRCRIRLNLITEHSILFFIMTLATSRLLFIIQNPEFYFQHINAASILNIFAIWDKGLSFWGAAAGWFGTLWYLANRPSRGEAKQLMRPEGATLRNVQPNERILDILTPAFLIGMAIGNFGAFLDGINYGSPTDLPIGLTFRSAMVKYITPIHPTQLYGMLYAAILAVLSLWLLVKLRGRLTGFIFEFGGICFAFLKFFEEFMRGDEALKIFSLRVPQLLAFAAIIVFGYLIYLRYHNKKGGDPELLLQQLAARIRRRKKVSSIVNPDQNQTTPISHPSLS